MDNLQSHKIYIEPNLIFYTSFQKFIEAKNLHEDYYYLLNKDKFFFNDLFSINRALVIAEPGYGKTRFLKEIILKAKDNKKEGIFIDLKKVDKDLESFINEKLTISDNIEEISYENIINNSTFFKTKNFLLKNTKKNIVCLDALDEVKQDKFVKVVDWIKEFSKKYEKILLFVSCRIHHFKKYQELFTHENFKYIKITSFTESQFQEYLQQSGLSEDDIYQIMVLFESADRDLLIQVPRYLEMITDIVRNEGAEYIKKLSKTEILEYFIYRKLELEEKKSNQQKKELIKRVLEKLALLMEIYQTNLLTKEELMTFFDDVKSNLNISFLQQVPIEIFYKRSLLKDNIDTIEFENTEFQEYLAAKEILRLGRVDQIIFDIAVDQELREIFPSWFNTLGFIIDMDISLLKPILSFLFSKDSIVQDEEYHRLLTKVDTKRLSIEDRKEIFKNVFNYYQKTQHWIRFDIARNLSYYFDASLSSLLKKSINEEETSYITKGNVASIVEYLLERDLLSEKEREYWKNKLIEFSKEKNDVLQRHAISALSKFRDIKLLKSIFKFLNADDELVIRTFLTACTEVNPNDRFSIQCFVNHTKTRKEYITARYGLWKITEKKAIKYLLRYFIEDSNFLTEFIETETIFGDDDNQIIQNIKKVWDKEIQKKCENIIIAAFSNERWYLAERSQFIKNLALMLKEKNKNYIFKLISEIGKSEILKENLFGFLPIFTLLLKREQVDKFVQKLKQVGGEHIALWTLQSKKNDDKEIYETGRKYFKEEYDAWEKKIKRQSVKKNKDLELYEKFRIKLQPAKGMYDIDVFSFYLNHKEQLKSFLRKEDKERLKELIVKSVFEKFDPGEQKLTITKKEDTSISYTTHRFIHIFGDCLRVAKVLNIDISKYRQRIINYIPFAYTEHRKIIFSLVSNPTNKEIENLLKIYTQKRKDDLPKFMPDSFIEACEKYNIVKAIPILKRFVDETEFFIYTRRAALQAIANIQPDVNYFRQIFRKYSRKTDESHQLAEEANRFLIEKFSDDNAISWRLNQLVKRCFPFIEQHGVHTVSPQENELYYKGFASPIMNLKIPKYKEQFFRLLDKSFEIYTKGSEYWAYAQYLWQIVITYFNNLKVLKSYSHLKDLENYILQHSTQEGMNWFKYKLHTLRREYMRHIGKPQNFEECIKKYNRLKENQYLDIATSIDLVEVVKEAINEDLRKWVESEGAYKFIQEASRKQEDLIQKTLKTQFENSLLKRGFRKNEVNIRREEQLLDNQRTDFLISYGFIGPVLIEIKRVDNPEIRNEKKRWEYKNKLLKYIEGTNSVFGILLLVQINDKCSLKEYLSKVKEIYKDYKNIEVMELNCISNIGNH